MKIAICQSSIPDYRYPIFNRLATLPGVELTLYIATPPNPQPTNPATRFQTVYVPEHEIPLSRGAILYRPDFARIIKSKHADLVILPWNIRYLNLRAAVHLGRRHNVPVLLWGHGYSKHPHRYKHWYRNLVGREADGVLLYTHTVADALVRNARFDPSRVFVAQNALDQTPIAQAREAWLAKPRALAEFRTKNRLNPANTLLFVSRLLPENRPHLLLEGFRRLLKTRPDAHLAIIGEGPDERRLRALASRLGIEPRVRFLGPIFDENALAPWMLSAGLFAYPVNIGLSLMHAFGYGLPTVTSDALHRHGPEIEALVHGVNGLFYHDRDLDHMVHAWKAILEDPLLRARFSRAALKTVTDKYSATNMIDGFLSALTLAGYPTPTSAPIPFLPASGTAPGNRLAHA